jgi:hypothetical protein
MLGFIIIKLETRVIYFFYWTYTGVGNGYGFPRIRMEMDMIFGLTSRIRMDGGYEVISVDIRQISV